MRIAEPSQLGNCSEMVTGIRRMLHKSSKWINLIEMNIKYIENER